MINFCFTFVVLVFKELCKRSAKCEEKEWSWFACAKGVDMWIRQLKQSHQAVFEGRRWCAHWSAITTNQPCRIDSRGKKKKRKKCPVKFIRICERKHDGRTKMDSKKAVIVRSGRKRAATAKMKVSHCDRFSAQTGSGRQSPGSAASNKWNRKQKQLKVEAKTKQIEEKRMPRPTEDDFHVKKANEKGKKVRFAVANRVCTWVSIVRQKWLTALVGEQRFFAWAKLLTNANSVRVRFESKSNSPTTIAPDRRLVSFESEAEKVESCANLTNKSAKLMKGLRWKRCRVRQRWNRINRFN